MFSLEPPPQKYISCQPQDRLCLSTNLLYSLDKNKSFSKNLSRGIPSPTEVVSKLELPVCLNSSSISGPATEDVKQSVLSDLKNHWHGLAVTALANEQASPSKQAIRRLHSGSVNERRNKEASFISENLSSLECYFANGSDVDLDKFSPEIVPVNTNSVEAALFRLTTLLWSVPVSRGFGRSVRFIVIDKANNKLIGLLGLTDPVLNLRTRDDWIGWRTEEKCQRLYNVMDMFVLGAVPPYSELLCGKLIAMLGASNEVREFVELKYRGRKTQIEKIEKNANLAMLTVSSSLGRSSIYNRVKFNERKLLTRIGLTTGWGHFHLSETSFRLLRTYLESINHPVVKANRFGDGPNWRIRVIRYGLASLGLSSRALFHGVQREVYVCSLAKNSREFLCGNTSLLDYYDAPSNQIIEYFSSRWMIPRSNRDNSYLSVKAADTLHVLKCLLNGKQAD
jgi:hypothetical protein